MLMQLVECFVFFKISNHVTWVAMLVSCAGLLAGLGLCNSTCTQCSLIGSSVKFQLKVNSMCVCVCARARARAHFPQRRKLQSRYGCARRGLPLDFPCCPQVSRCAPPPWSPHPPSLSAPTPSASFPYRLHTSFLLPQSAANRLREIVI